MTAGHSDSTTVIVSGNALGETIPPYVIYKGHAQIQKVLTMKTSFLGLMKGWSRGQTDIYGLFCEFVAPPRKKNLITIFS